MMPGSGPRVFALEASRAYGESVCRALGVALAPHEERVFEDGEHKCRPTESVRGCDVFVIQSLYGEAGQSADDKLCRLLFFIGALRDAAAGRITAIVPYLAYARKDQRTKPRDPVTTRYIAAMFEALGTDCVVAMDVHNVAAYQNAFRCVTEHLEAAPLFVREIAPLVGGDDVVVVSPDAGGIKRADAFRQRLAQALGRPVGTAFAEKYRGSREIRGEALVGEVRGRTAIIVDDMISAGNTVARAAQACRTHGAARVIAAATHGVFAPEADGILSGAGLDRILVTDSIPPMRIADPGVRARLQQVTTAPMVAEAIRRLHAGSSMATLPDDTGG